MTAAADLRSHLRHVVNVALAAVSPQTCLQSVTVSEGRLIVRDLSIDLARVHRIVVVGMGKASAGMAASLEGILDGRISDGVVVTADGYKVPTRSIEVVEAAHPIPDARGLAAAGRIACLVEDAQEEDLVIVLISGGGSALLSLPVQGITIAELAATNELLIRSGATIEETNTVRKHLSQLKGGQLARRAYPAQVLTLVLSDVPGDPLTGIASGPTVADPTTFSEAASILRRYGLWNKVPQSVRDHVTAGVLGGVPETPKLGDAALARVKSVIVGSGASAAAAAVEVAEQLGYHALLLTTTLEGEACTVGRVFAAIAREEASTQRPVPLPALIVAAGETTVRVTGDGKGGRNQEFALAAATGIKGFHNIVIAAVATDGRDGPTDAAGGMVDGSTAARLLSVGIVPEESIRRNDSYHALATSGDLIVIGPTGTNVADLYFIAVRPSLQQIPG